MTHRPEYRLCVTHRVSVSAVSVSLPVRLGGCLLRRLVAPLFLPVVRPVELSVLLGPVGVLTHPHAVHQAEDQGAEAPNQQRQPDEPAGMDTWGEIQQR